MYSLNFLVTSLAIPLAIGYATYIWGTKQQAAALDAAQKQQATALNVAEKQQATALNVADRQRLANGLLEYGRTYGEYHSATRTIKLLSLRSDSIPASDLEQAILKLDLAMASLGQKLIPFEEYVRRTSFYPGVAENEPSQLQRVWDKCFVQPYWVGSKEFPAYFERIARVMDTGCNGTNCDHSAAAEVDKIAEQIYEGHCRGDEPKLPKDSFNFIWFHRELRRITIQEDEGSDPYQDRRT